MTRFDFSQDPLLTANIRNSLLRGSCELLEDTEEGIFIYDIPGNVFILYAPLELGKSWLCKHEGRSYKLLVLYDDALAAFVAVRYGLQIDEKCKQVVWMHSEPPATAEKLRFHTATEADMALCLQIYHNSSEADVRQAVKAGNVMLGYKDETLVGMIGIHMEGSMGMLEVLPEYRRRGYGTELEKALIARQLESGLLPYGQVYLSNEASFALQASIGMECSEGTLIWLFPKG